MSEAAALVERFARAWAEPRLDTFVALMTPDVHLRAPLVEPTVGTQAAYEEFARLLYVWPSVHGVVDQWSAVGSSVFIEWRMEGDIGRKHLSFRLVDRIVAKDGLIAEREMFGDGLAIATPFRRSPRHWLRIWRSGIAPTHGLRRVMRATTSAKRFRPRQGAGPNQAPPGPEGTEGV